MMRIVHVTPYYAPAFTYGGVVSASTGLSAAQAAAGHAVTVLTTDAMGKGKRSRVAHESIDGVSVRRFSNRLPFLRQFNVSTPIGVGRAARVADPEVIHCHELRTVENLAATGNARCPLVLSPHGTLPYETGRSVIKRGWDRLIGRHIARHFTGVIALTEGEKADVLQLWAHLRLPAPLIEVIPNGVTIPQNWRFTQRPYQQPVDGLFNIMFLGRLHERKGLQFLIPAFARAGLANARLVIVGPDDGMLDRLRMMAERYAVADRVLFAGYLGGEAREQVLRNADVFVLPAQGEGLSMAALEAMAAGVPVILTPGCNLPQTVERGAGLIVERDVEPLAGALQTLMGDAAMRARMGIAARAWMTRDFAWPAMAARMVAFYQTVIEAHQQPPL
jgi:glycosyltransferase involved in cell wall biosynthesis